MTLIQITSENFDKAIDAAWQIFPYEVHNGVFWPRCAYLESIEENNPDFSYYLAYHNYELVGITGHYPDKGTMWLGWFGILPNYRGKGLGELLLNSICEKIVDLGYTNLHLYSGNREEEENAHNLYFKKGFEQYKTGYVDGEPVLYFRRELPLC